MEGTNGKAVLLIHGLTGVPAEMKFIGKHLNRAGYTVFAPELVGHCRDDATLLKTKYEDIVEGLLKDADKLRKEFSEVHAAGICVGGALGLAAESQSPGLFKSLTIYAPALSYDGWNQSIWARPIVYFGEIIIRLPGFKKRRFIETHPFGIKSDRIRNAVMQGSDVTEGTLPYFPALMLYENFRLVKFLKKKLSNIKVPTLLVHSKEDDVCHPRNSFAIQKRHGGECKVEIIDNCYHMIHVDQERSKVAQMTADFIAGKVKNA